MVAFIYNNFKHKLHGHSHSSSNWPPPKSVQLNFCLFNTHTHTRARAYRQYCPSLRMGGVFLRMWVSASSELCLRSASISMNECIFDIMPHWYITFTFKWDEDRVSYAVRVQFNKKTSIISISCPTKILVCLLLFLFTLRGGIDSLCCYYWLSSPHKPKCYLSPIRLFMSKCARILIFSYANFSTL